MQADLFKRFFRGDRQDTDDPSIQAGAGLGLAIVHDILALHGGDVRYEDASGGGARFVLRIPLAVVEREERDARNGEQTTPPAAQAPRVGR